MRPDEEEWLCLEIMANGEDMLAIGRWEAVIARLVEKGFAEKIGNGYRVTQVGLEAFDRHDTDELRMMIGWNNARIMEKNAPVIDGEAEEVPCPRQ